MSSFANSRNLLNPSVANNGPSAVSVAAGLPFAQVSGGLHQPAAAAPTPASGSVSQPLGGLIQGIGNIPSAIAGGIEKIGNQSFMFDSQIQARSSQMQLDLMAELDAEFEAGKVTSEEFDQLKAQIKLSSDEQAAEEGASANNAAAGTVVGLRAAQEGFNIAMTHRLVKDQINTIQNNTERFLNGIEFNAGLQRHAQDLVSMKNNLRTVDSILQQTGAIQAGKQQQVFARNPATGNLITEL